MMSMTLLTVFIVSYFLHLSARVPALGAMRFDLLLGALILVSIFFTQVEDKWRRSIETTRKLNLLLLYVLLSLPFVTWPGSVIQLHLVDWIKTVLFFVFVVSIVRTEIQLKWIMAVFISCQVFRIFEPLYMHITTGYWGDIAYSHVGGGMTGLNRLGGAPYDVVNSTQLGWVVVTTVPFLFYLLFRGSKKSKLLFIALAPPVIYGFLLTGARSGLVSLTITILAIIMLSKRKAKAFVITAAVLVPAAIIFSGKLSSDMQTRYISLVDSNVTGADTVQGRITASLRQLGTLSNNPLFGNGLGTSRETNWNVTGKSSQITHNLYIEVLQEFGLVGFVVFMLYIVSIITSLKQAKRILEERGVGDDNWLYRLVCATLVWVVMDLVYSLSCFGLRSWEWYFFGGIATLCLAFARSQVLETDTLITEPLLTMQSNEVETSAVK